MPSDPAELEAWVAALPSEHLDALNQQADGSPTGSPSPLGGLDTLNHAIDLPPAPDELRLLTFSIELKGVQPRIWRRLALRGDLTLDAVHPLLQAAMGWTDSHLHRFQPGSSHGYDEPYFVTPFDEEEEGDDGTHEADVRLDQVLRAPGDQLTYLYDFGDGWEHLLTLESVAPLTQTDRAPVCLDGAGACPPEDVGGVPGYEEVADWLRAGARDADVPDGFDDAEHARGWLPPGYDPDVFDAAEATAEMQVWARGEHLLWHGLPQPLADLVQGLRDEGWVQATTWLTDLGPRLAVPLDEDDVRGAAKPWQAVLDAVGEGTKLTAAGYLPPLMVEQIAQAAGVATWWIGKANREDLTWPVAALRQHTQDLGLLRKAKGTLTPTARARTAAHQPRALVAAVLERLPIGKGFDAHAGWFLLLGLATGESGAALDTGVAAMLTDRGWRTQDGAEIDSTQAGRGARETLDALESMAGGYRSVDPDLLTRLARATLFGIVTNS